MTYEPQISQGNALFLPFELSCFTWCRRRERMATSSCHSAHRGRASSRRAHGY